MSVSTLSLDAPVESIEELKTSIRAEMILQRERLSSETVQSKSLEIAERLFELEDFVRSKNVLFYLSIPREVQTAKMIQRSFDLGKSVYVPIMAEGNRLDLSEIKNLDLEFENRAFGVREPKRQDRIPADPKVLDLIVVPGLAFDAKGGRIGFGGGYFDRLLTEVAQSASRVAVAFDFQILGSVPQTPRDVSMHRILTENTIINC